MESVFPRPIHFAVEAVLHCRVGLGAKLSGGDVNHAVKIQTENGAAAVVKWHDDAPPGAFACEADGLRALGETGAIRVPHVLAVSEAPAFLVMEWIPSVEPDDEAAFSRRFAHQLAQMHQTTAKRGEPFGYAINNYLGSQPQTNTPRTTNWADFYRDHRLMPQWERAQKLKRTNPERDRLIGGVVEKLPALLEAMPPNASLLHGDLWRGNFLCAFGEDVPVLIDPAVYYGPREMEIAYVELFGGFPLGFMAHYHEAWPLDAGYAQRRPLHQLYPLLIHLNHFGEGYGPRVDAACQACL